MNNKIKNHWVTVKGLHTVGDETVATAVNCIITNDEHGKTLSVGTEESTFTIPFEPIEKYLQ